MVSVSIASGRSDGAGKRGPMLIETHIKGVRKERSPRGSGEQVSN